MKETYPKPLVSVIVRTKDRPELLKRALKSIADQSYRPVEVVLVNDGVCELDTEELRGILGDVVLEYLRHEDNRGRPVAGNTGLEHASGEYIAFLDDDDRYYENFISVLIDVMFNGGAGLVYGKCDCFQYNGQGRERLLTLGKPFNIYELFYRNFIPINSILTKKALLSDIGGFDSDFEIFEDWDLLFRLALKNDFLFVEEVVSEYSIFGSATVTYKGGHEYHKQYWDLFYKKHADFFGVDALEHCVLRTMEEKSRSLLEENKEVKRELSLIKDSKAWKLLRFYRKLKKIGSFMF